MGKTDHHEGLTVDVGEGLIIDVRRPTVDVGGLTVDVRGPTVDVRGLTVDVGGPTDDVGKD